MSTTQAHESDLLLYGCTGWRKSSQAAYNLYRGGTKLWTKAALLDIEQQLAQSKTRRIFTVRSIDGTVISIVNPMFGEQHPIWVPCVKFHEYWQLVREQPSDPPETYHCTYFVKWVNVSAQLFWDIPEHSRRLFDENRAAWSASASCKALTSQLEAASATKKVRKIVCIGLGDMCRAPPGNITGGSSDSEFAVEAAIVRSRMLQHSIALTMAEICRRRSARDVHLLAQDPAYLEQTMDILKESGFSFVGPHGAAGFAEVDEETLVFSAFVGAPLKQIIADIARPQFVIAIGVDTFTESGKPYLDAESPRTVEMWKGYEMTRFPVPPEDGDLVKEMENLYIYTKKDEHRL